MLKLIYVGIIKTLHQTKNRRLLRRGDTIVEVLIAVAIVSSVLAGAFTVTQKSTQAVRDGQERSEVLHILQGQVEMVRSTAMEAAGYTDPLFDSTHYFCMVEGTANRQDFTDPNPPASDYSNYNSACKNLGAGHLYNVADSYDGIANVFTFQAHWQNVSGSSDNEVLYYKVYPGSLPAPIAPGGGVTGGIDAAFDALSNLKSGGKGGPLNPCFTPAKYATPRCWQITLVNQSNNVNGSLSKCVVDWGDPLDPAPSQYPGNAPQCQMGGQIFHQYPPRATDTTFTIVLTNYSSADGSTKTWTVSLVRPF